MKAIKAETYTVMSVKTRVSGSIFVLRVFIAVHHLPTAWCRRLHVNSSSIVKHRPSIPIRLSLESATVAVRASQVIRPEFFRRPHGRCKKSKLPVVSGENGRASAINLHNSRLQLCSVKFAFFVCGIRVDRV